MAFQDDIKQIIKLKKSKKHMEALALCDQQLKNFLLPTEKFKIYVLQAEVYYEGMRKGKSTEVMKDGVIQAIKLAYEIMQISADRETVADLYSIHGKLLSYLSIHPAAVKAFTYALSLREDAFTYSKRAESLREIEEYELAENDLIKAFNLNRERGLTWYDLAQLYDRQRRHFDALRAVQTAIKFDATLENAATMKKKLLALLGLPPDTKIEALQVEPKSKNQQVVEDLFAAVAANQIWQVERLLRPAYIIEKNTQGDTLLHVAARHGHVSIFEVLSDRGVDRNAFNNRQQTPFVVAVEEGQLEIVRHLLRIGNAMPLWLGKSMLELASENGHVELVNFLLSRSESDEKSELLPAESKDEKQIAKSSNLPIEITGGSGRRASELGTKKPEVKQSDSLSQAIYSAVLCSQDNVVCDLLDKNPDYINKRYYHEGIETTLLHVAIQTAAQTNSESLIRSLLFYQPDFTQTDTHAKKRTPLQLAEQLELSQFMGLLKNKIEEITREKERGEAHLKNLSKCLKEKLSALSQDNVTSVDGHRLTRLLKDKRINEVDDKLRIVIRNTITIWKWLCREDLPTSAIEELAKTLVDYLSSNLHKIFYYDPKKQSGTDFSTDDHALQDYIRNALQAGLYSWRNKTIIQNGEKQLAKIAELIKIETEKAAKEDKRPVQNKITRERYYKPKRVTVLIENLIQVIKQTPIIWHWLCDNTLPDVFLQKCSQDLFNLINNDCEKIFVHDKQAKNTDFVFRRDALLKCVSAWGKELVKNVITIEEKQEKTKETTSEKQDVPMPRDSLQLFRNQFGKRFDEMYHVFWAFDAEKLQYAEDNRIDQINAAANYLPDIPVPVVGGHIPTAAVIQVATSVYSYARNHFRHNRAGRVVALFSGLTLMERAEFIDHAAHALALRYAEQIKYLEAGSGGIEHFANCVVDRVITYIGNSDNNRYAKTPGMIGKITRLLGLLIGKKLAREESETESLENIFFKGIIEVQSDSKDELDRLRTLGNVHADDWKAREILENTGVVIERNGGLEFYSNDRSNPMKYGYCWGTLQEITVRGLKLQEVDSEAVRLARFNYLPRVATESPAVASGFWSQSSSAQTTSRQLQQSEAEALKPASASTSATSK